MRGVMTSNNRISLIAIHRFLASFLIMLSALSATAIAQNPVPLINQPLVPDAAVPGGKGFTLTVNGTGFVSGSVANWNGSPLATAFVSGSQLTASVPASYIAKASTASVTVVSPGLGGTSNVAFLEIGTATFAHLSGTDYAVTTSLSITSGDFNGDGKLDLAVADQNRSIVSILLGNGDGTFGPSVEYATGQAPTHVATGDFNADGKLDLVTVDSFGGNTVSILLGNGDGTFQPHVDYATGGHPFVVAVGDFNRDGRMDLAIANNIDNTLSVLLGNGDGTFQPQVTYPTAPGPAEGVTGDFNGDGKLDLAVSNFGNYTGDTVSIFLGNGDGTFQAHVDYPTGQAPGAMVVADLNGDGKLDLVTGNVDNAISVLLGNGDGTFQAPVNYLSGVNGSGGVAAGDFYGDGKLDLAFSNYWGSSIGLLIGNGDGTFQGPTYFATGANPHEVTVGDFNGDGRLDLVAPSEFSSTVSVLLEAGTVTLSPPSVNFGVQLLGSSSPTRTVTLTNIGTSTLNISSIVITGNDFGDFSEKNTCSSSLASKAHCTISVTFMPGQLGPRTASVTLTDSDPGSSQSVPLNGFGVTSGPNATLSAASLTFASQLVGTSSSAQSVTLTNYGTMALSLASIVATGDFHETHTCGSGLAVLGTCTISVTFTPTKNGSRAGKLLITDNAPGSPQAVSLKGTGTAVEFNPTSLAFHCHNVPTNTCPPPPQTTTLTNTGSTTLSISSITITGSTTFSQTNTCSSSVVAKGSCTITVTFKSSSRGTFSGAVSVSDNGGGSPQKMSLSGTESKTGAGALAVRSAMAAHSTAAVPSLTGPSHVGTRVMDLVDSTRDNPFQADGTKRELLVRFWYPASVTQGCESAEYTAPAVWSYFSQLAGFPLPEVKTNSCLDAPITEGPHPVVVFTHGYTGTFTDYTFLLEDLASRGYVVASVDHTSEATAVEFPDGRFVKSVFGSHLDESTWLRDEQDLSFAVSVRSKDLKFVVDELARLNGEASGPFAGKLDLTRVAVAGHSLGGLAALLGLKQDARFKAAVLLDASVPDGSASLTDTPVLILAMGRERWSDEECRLWSDLRGPRFAVNLKGAEHLTPSDAVWLAKGAIKAGPMGTEKNLAAVRDYITAFLDTNLRGKPSAALLTGPSVQYPDAAVTTQKQLLCTEAIDH
jgi:dienelactone hydrolase